MTCRPNIPNQRDLDHRRPDLPGNDLFFQGIAGGERRLSVSRGGFSAQIKAMRRVRPSGRARPVPGNAAFANFGSDADPPPKRAHAAARASA